MEVSGQPHAPAALFHGKEARGTHCIGRWMGLTAGLDTVAKRKYSLHCPCRESNPGSLAHTLVTILIELPRLLLTIYQIYDLVTSKGLDFFKSAFHISPVGKMQGARQS
jgi:hypothetical protein